MKHAVIQTGGKQYLVTLGQELDVELLKTDKKLEFEPLLVFDEKDVQVGQSIVEGVKVQAEVVESIVKGEKLRIIRYKAKKRVNKQTGHRQKYTRIKVIAIGNTKAPIELKRAAKNKPTSKIKAAKTI